MSNLVLDRLLQEKAQPIAFRQPFVQTEEKEPEQLVDSSPIVSPDILRKKLEEKLDPKPQITMSPDTSEPKIEIVHFANIFEFVHWYENNKTSFSEKQTKPLDTLIEAKNITLGGCNCDREKRVFIAGDYFRKFWSQNKSTDLLPTLTNILKTKKVVFGDFLSYPE